MLISAIQFLIKLKVHVKMVFFYKFPCNLRPPNCTYSAPLCNISKDVLNSILTKQLWNNEQYLEVVNTEDPFLEWERFILKIHNYLLR